MGETKDKVKMSVKIQSFIQTYFKRLGDAMYILKKAKEDGKMPETKEAMQDIVAARHNIDMNEIRAEEAEKKNADTAEKKEVKKIKRLDKQEDGNE